MRMRDEANFGSEISKGKEIPNKLKLKIAVICWSGSKVMDTDMDEQRATRLLELLLRIIH